MYYHLLQSVRSVFSRKKCAVLFEFFQMHVKLLAALRAHTSVCFVFQRLLIAKEFGDRAAERRAYCNLGNAYVFLGEFDKAAEHYK